MANAVPTHIGHAPFRTWHTWYTIFGELKPGAGKTPLITCHGGPGAGCYTHEVMAGLWLRAGIPVVIYDQCGCGRSTHLPDEPPETFTIDFYLEELSNLLKHLGIETYHLLGHSWGGMLVNEHAARRPAGLQKIILECSPASIELCMQRQNECYSSLGEQYYEAILKHDRDGTVSEDYEEGTRRFSSWFLCRTLPLPESVKVISKTLQEAYNVCNTMWGLTKDTECTGNLKDWTIIPRLHLIENEVLVLTATYDYCGGKALVPFVDHLKRVRMVTFPEAGHLAHIDAEIEYMTCVADFLTD